MRAQSLFATRIANFRVEPTVAKVGEPIKIGGNLQWFCPLIMCPPFGKWMGYDNQRVELYVNSQKVDETTTVGGGQFTFQKTFEAGTYEIAVHYPGSWKDNPCWSPKVVVRVLEPEEYEQEMQKTWMLYGALAIGVGAIGLIAFEMYRMKREEELMLSLRR